MPPGLAAVWAQERGSTVQSFHVNEVKVGMWCEAYTLGHVEWKEHVINEYLTTEKAQWKKQNARSSLTWPCKLNIVDALCTQIARCSS